MIYAMEDCNINKEVQTMLRLIDQGIEHGNIEIHYSDLRHVVDELRLLTHAPEFISAEEASMMLGMKKETFRKYADGDRLPKGRKRMGLPLVWDRHRIKTLLPFFGAEARKRQRQNATK